MNFNLETTEPTLLSAGHRFYADKRMSASFGLMECTLFIVYGSLVNNTNTDS